MTTTIILYILVGLIYDSILWSDETRKAEILEISGDIFSPYAVRVITAIFCSIAWPYFLYKTLKK